MKGLIAENKSREDGLADVVSKGRIFLFRRERPRPNV